MMNAVGKNNHSYWPISVGRLPKHKIMGFALRQEESVSEGRWTATGTGTGTGRQLTFRQVQLEGGFQVQRQLQTATSTDTHTHKQKQKEVSVSVAMSADPPRPPPPHPNAAARSSATSPPLTGFVCGANESPSVSSRQQGARLLRLPPLRPRSLCLPTTTTPNPPTQSTLSTATSSNPVPLLKAHSVPPSLSRCSSPTTTMKVQADSPSQLPPQHPTATPTPTTTSSPPRSRHILPGTSPRPASASGSLRSFNPHQQQQQQQQAVGLLQPVSPALINNNQQPLTLQIQHMHHPQLQKLQKRKSLSEMYVPETHLIPPRLHQPIAVSPGGRVSLLTDNTTTTTTGGQSRSSSVASVASSPPTFTQSQQQQQSFVSTRVTNSMLSQQHTSINNNNNNKPPTPSLLLPQQQQQHSLPHLQQPFPNQPPSYNNGTLSSSEALQSQQQQSQQQPMQHHHHHHHHHMPSWDTLSWGGSGGDGGSDTDASLLRRRHDSLSRTGRTPNTPPNQQPLQPQGLVQTYVVPFLTSIRKMVLSPVIRVPRGRRSSEFNVLPTDDIVDGDVDAFTFTDGKSMGTHRNHNGHNQHQHHRVSMDLGSKRHSFDLSSFEDDDDAYRVMNGDTKPSWLYRTTGENKSYTHSTNSSISTINGDINNLNTLSSLGDSVATIVSAVHDSNTIGGMTNIGNNGNINNGINGGNTNIISGTGGGGGGGGVNGNTKASMVMKGDIRTSEDNGVSDHTMLLKFGNRRHRSAVYALRRVLFTAVASVAAILLLSGLELVYTSLKCDTFLNEGGFYLQRGPHQLFHFLYKTRHMVSNMYLNRFHSTNTYDPYSDDIRYEYLFLEGLKPHISLTFDAKRQLRLESANEIRYTTLETLPKANYPDFLNLNISTVSAFKQICEDFDWLSPDHKFYVATKPDFASIVRRYSFCFLSEDAEFYLPHFIGLHKSQMEIEHTLFPWHVHRYFDQVSRRVLFLSDERQIVAGRGIVVSAAKSHLPYVKGLVAVLRDLGNKLPLEVWQGTGSFSKSDLQALRKIADDEFSITLHDIDDGLTATFHQKLNKFANKLIALVMTKLEEVILLDADSIPLMNPEAFFDEEPYKESGMYMFRDRKIRSRMRPLFREMVMNMLPWNSSSLMSHDFYRRLLSYESLNPGELVPSLDMSTARNRLIYAPEPFTKRKITLEDIRFNGLGQNRQHTVESGLVVLNKKRHFGSLLMATNLMFFKDLLELLNMGDKEVFWLGPLIMGDVDIRLNAFSSVAIGKAQRDSDSIQVCTTHPAHIDNSGKRLLWVNSGLEMCKFNAQSHGWSRPPIESRILDVDTVMAVEEEGDLDSGVGWTSHIPGDQCQNYMWCARRKDSETTPLYALDADFRDFFRSKSRVWIEGTLR